MANAGKTTSQLNQANSFYSANDRIVILYGMDTANTANSLAQTATITVTNSLTSLFLLAPFPTVSYSTLPTPIAGMVVNVSDANTNVWGANITVGSGPYNVLARYNGTHWTVVGI